MNLIDGKTFLGFMQLRNMHFQDNHPCHKGNYDSYLKEEVTRQMLAIYGCTVVFDPLSDSHPICNYTQAVRALEYYEQLVIPATSDVLLKSYLIKYVNFFCVHLCSTTLNIIIFLYIYTT